MHSREPVKYTKKQLARVINKVKLASSLLTREMPPVPPVEIPARYLFCMDSPKNDIVGGRNLVVSGWLIPLGGLEIIDFRIRNNERTFKIKHGEKRADVAVSMPSHDKNQATYCGFSRIINVEAGHLILELDLGNGYELLHQVEVHTPEDKSVKAMYSPDFGKNYAEHLNLTANKKRYYYQEPLTQSYKRHEKDPKLITFYLPQYHPIKENDKVWGKGFTEWNNVAAATPRFTGHLQPLLPKDLGFYDLRLDSNILEQINLAKNNGIYGFCLYYYWFSGKKLLDTPINSIVRHKEWDFNFMICWANENWTKRWDGLDKDVIIAQKYLDQDPIDFIKDVEHILLDSRYIQRDGKPILAVYRASELKDPAMFALVWRDFFKKKHHRDLHLVSMVGFEAVDPRTYGFDGSIDFMPLSSNLKKSVFPDEKVPTVYIKDRLLDTNYESDAADYRKLALNSSLDDFFDFPNYKSLIPSWDNDARRKGKNSTIFYHSNPNIYAHWLDRIITSESLRAGSEPPIIFINAWNEWAEGAVLEPTQHYGHAFLNRTAEVMAKHSQASHNKKIAPRHGIKRKSDTKLAVVVHVFYEKEWLKIKKKLSNLEGTSYDLHITLTERLGSIKDAITRAFPEARVVVVPNRGRDILPFLFVASQLKDAGYEYVHKHHTKRSLHRQDGQEWFTHLIDSLLPSKRVVDKIIAQLETGTAMVGPQEHWVALSSYIGSNDRRIIELLTDMYDEEKAAIIIEALGGHGYFAGSMFWARLDALAPLLDLYLAPEDFESEKSQVDGTLAHSVERLFGLMPILGGRNIYESSKNGIKEVDRDDAKSIYKYAS